MTPITGSDFLASVPLATVRAVIYSFINASDGNDLHVTLAERMTVRMEVMVNGRTNGVSNIPCVSNYNFA